MSRSAGAIPHRVPAQAFAPRPGPHNPPHGPATRTGTSIDTPAGPGPNSLAAGGPGTNRSAPARNRLRPPAPLKGRPAADSLPGAALSVAALPAPQLQQLPGYAEPPCKQPRSRAARAVREDFSESPPSRLCASLESRSVIEMASGGAYHRASPLVLNLSQQATRPRSAPRQAG